jgi:holliday junction DNA helicase RuvA
VAEQTITASRSDDPRVIARDGLIGLGYSPQEVEGLLNGLVGATPEELISEALRAARQ